MNEIKEKREESITNIEKLLILFAETQTHCLTLSELLEKTKMNRKTLLVYLHKMIKRRLIDSRWIYVDKEKGKKERLYCLEVRV